MVGKPCKYYSNLRLLRRPSCFCQQCVRCIAPLIAAGSVDRIGKIIQRLCQFCGIDVAGSGSLIAHSFCHSADGGDFCMMLQRQKAIFIFQKYCAFRCRTFGKDMVGFVVAGSRRFQRFLCPEHQLQHPTGAVIHAAFRQRAVLDSLQNILFHVVAAAGHIQVAACPEAIDAVVHRAPVRDHHAAEAPLGSENIR